MSDYATGLRHGWEDQAAAIRIILLSGVSDVERLALIEKAVTMPPVVLSAGDFAASGGRHVGSVGGISTGDKTP